MLGQDSLIVDKVERIQRFYFFSDEFVFGFEISDVIIDWLYEDTVLHKSLLDLLDFIDELHHRCLVFGVDLKLDQYSPEEQKFLFLLNVFDVFLMLSGEVAESWVPVLLLGLLSNFLEFVFLLLDLLRVGIAFEVDHVFVLKFEERFLDKFFGDFTLLNC